MNRRTVAVVSAGLRQPSSTRLLADRLAEATVRALDERETKADVRVLELRDHAHDLTNNLLTGFPSATLSEAIDDVVTADGLVAVTPVFAASYGGLFKSFFDVLDVDALAGMPVLVAATGGTERHSLVLEHAMRPLFTYLRSVVVPTGVYAATSDWGQHATAAQGGTDDLGLDRRIERGAGELAALIAGSAAREKTDPFDTPTPFEQLLAQRDDEA